MRALKMSALVLAMSLSLFAAESPFSGTWTLNPAKSTPPAPKSDTAVVDVNENRIKFNEDIVDDKGAALKLSYEAKFDGKDYPVTGAPDADSISYARYDAHKLEGTIKKGGKITAKLTAVVSKDGKTTTVDFIDYSQAKPVTSTSVYDKL
jgi:hypothetical protein